MVDLSKLKDPSPWVPTTSLTELKILGKALEELGEGISAIARVLIQGIDEAEPVTGKPNREWLTDEVADIHAGLEIITGYYQLNVDTIDERKKRKISHLRRWHMLGKAPVRCTYPTCTCIVSTSTSNPIPKCPKDYDHE